MRMSISCQGVLQAVDAARGPEEKLYAVIVAHVTSLLQHQDWHATANEQLNALPEPRRREIIALRDAYQAQVRRIIEDAQGYRLPARRHIPKATQHDSARHVDPRLPLV